MRIFTLEIAAAQLRSVRKIAPPQLFWCVNRSLIRYDFVAGQKLSGIGWSCLNLAVGSQVPSFRNLFTHYYLGAWNKLWDLSQFLRFRCLVIACAGWWVELDPIIHLGATLCYVGDNTVSGCWNKHLLGSVQEVVEEGVQCPGAGGTSYNGLYREAHQKGVPFKASDIGKGRNFSTVEPLHNGHLAPCKGIQDRLGFWIPRTGFRILGTGFQIFFSGTWILDSNF